MKGVVAGIRDYGNRMGIPTVNGAVIFDDRYLGNPLVYCGNVGLLPAAAVEKNPRPGDWIVEIDGRPLLSEKDFGEATTGPAAMAPSVKVLVYRTGDAERRLVVLK